MVTLCSDNTIFHKSMDYPLIYRKAQKLMLSSKADCDPFGFKKKKDDHISHSFVMYGGAYNKQLKVNVFGHLNPVCVS